MSINSEHEVRHGIDFTELADWAESDEATRTPQTSPVLHGEEAQRASRALLGRDLPSVGQSHAMGKGN